MSSTLLSIRTNEQIKKKIANFAASLGLSTSAFATAVLLQAVREKKVVLTTSPLEPTPYLEKTIQKAEEDYKKGHNVTRVTNKEELDEYLRNL